MNQEWKARYDLAVLAAQEAGQLALDYFDAGTAVEWKADESPVTVGDRNAEQLLRKTLLGRFPQDGFLGEEFGDHPGTSGYRWIIDPIDGTRSFVRNIPLWGTMVGLQLGDECIAGVVAMPAFGHIYRALKGDGAYRNERRIRVSDVAELKESILLYSSVYWFKKAGFLDNFLRLGERCQRPRGFGDVYGFMLVAQGSSELIVEHGVHIWDVAAVLPIIEEAGGRLTDWAGQVRADRPDVVASNGKVHAEALRVLNGT
jgi:histidinol-phosphatase